MKHSSGNMTSDLIRDGDLLIRVMDNTPDCCFIKDRNLCYVKVNGAHAVLLGLSDPSEAVGKSDLDLFREAEAVAIRDREKAVIESGSPAYAVEYTVSTRSGERFWLSGHSVPVKDGNGLVTGVVGIFRNVTEIKKMEQEFRNVNMRLSHTLAELKQTQQKIIQHERLNALGEMASGVAHDFNNALMPILGYTDILLSRPDILSKTDEVIGMLKDIRTATMDAAQAVRRLREFYRTASEDEEFSGNLNKQIETAVILTRPKWKAEMGAKGVQIKVDTDLGNIPLVNAKESQLREILINLILNAVDAMPDGGLITLKTRRERGSVVLEICDTGTGMTEDVRKRCFEPFFTTKGDMGTGLGLSMVYGFVKRRNGVIDVLSVPGKGTTIVMRLPITIDGAVTGDVEDVHVVAGCPLTILVLDDELSARRLLEKYLKADGHTVELAETGEEGIRKFNEGKFDLVITDRAMPDMSGDKVAVAIRQINPKTPIIMVTGFGDIMNDEKQHPDGVDVVVSKPATHQDIRRAISRAVKGANGKT